MRARAYARPDSVEEAYEILSRSTHNRIIGGLTALKLLNASIETAIDLSGLGLDYVYGEPGSIRIGAYASLRRIEVSPDCLAHASGILAQAAGRIGGVQLRNQITLGGLVSSRWSTSEVIAVLLAMGAELSFFKAGTVELGEYLDRPVPSDILTEVRLARVRGAGALRSARKSYLDYPLLCVAVATAGMPKPGAAASDPRPRPPARIAVGARPGGPRLAEAAAAAFESGAGYGECAARACEELDFDDDSGASSWYRRRVCATLVQRALAEVAE